VTFTRRAAEPADATRLHAMYAAYDLVEFGSEDVELDDVTRMLVTEGSDRVVVEDADRLLGYAEVGALGEVETLVDPGYSEAHQLHADLLAWVVTQAASRQLGRIEHWAGTRTDGAAALLSAAGFEHARTTWQLRRSTAGPDPTPRWPKGVTVRPFAPDRDATEAWQLIQTSFAGTYGSHRRPYDEWALFALGGHRDLICAREADALIGVAVVGQRNGEGHVAQLAVLPAERGRGLGTALLHEAFRRDAAAGCPATTLEVDGENSRARRIYERAGMSVQQEYHRWERDV
jgi:ribosomal protein S18 acetylase RimI-like enzyme